MESSYCFHVPYALFLFVYKIQIFVKYHFFRMMVYIKATTYNGLYKIRIRWVTKEFQTLKRLHNTLNFGNHFSRVYRIKWSKLYVNAISTIKSYKDFSCSTVCDYCSFFQNLTHHFSHAFISECIFGRFVILKLICITEISMIAKVMKLCTMFLSIIFLELS